MTLCGRDPLIREIIEDCRADHFVVVSHEPGMGATALLRDGLLPALRQDGVVAVIWSEWQGADFVSELKQAIAEAVRTQADETFCCETETLDEMLERIHQRTGRVVALLLDQFEDYLRCHSFSHLADSFDAELAHAISCHFGRFVVALQRHALHPFDRFSQYVPNLLGFHRVLAPVSLEAAREAVDAECARRSMEIEEAATNALLGCGMITVPGGVHPFFLMCGLKRLLDAESRLKSTEARLSTIEMNGGPDRLILESLDGQLSDLSSTSAELLFRWCNLLISPEKTRISLTEKAMTDYAGKLNRFVLTTMPQLLEFGVLRTVQIGDVMRYEIARESLTPILHDWWTRREAALVARRRASFRVRSISVAGGAILLVYLIWLFVGK